MSRWLFIFRSLVHHRRIQLAVVLGVAAATAVLTGALLVGDSVRGSLRYIALDRIGRIDHIILSDHFFRAELASELAAQPTFQQQGWRDAVPAIVLQGTVQLTFRAESLDESGNESSGSTAAGQQDRQRSLRGKRAVRVTVLGVDDRFWDLGERYGAGQPVRPTPLPGTYEIVLNEPLAKAIDPDDDVDIGDEVVVRFARASDVPADSPMGRKKETIDKTSQLKVVAKVPAEGLGRFSLSPSQQLPRVAYVPLSTLQTALGQAGHVNAILVAVPSVRQRSSEPSTDDLIGLLRPSLDDFGLRIARVRRDFTDPIRGTPETIFDYFSLSSDRMLIRPEVDAAAQQAFAADNPQPVYTYLANWITKVGDANSHELHGRADGVPSDRDPGRGAIQDVAGRPIPYSTIVALNSTEQLGPLRAADGTPLPSLSDEEIVLHSWAAEHLDAVPGDLIEVTFFEPESTHGKVVQRTKRFRLKAIAPLTEPAESYSGDEPAVYTQRPTEVNDPDLTPEVPGVTDKASLQDWKPPFPFDRKRIKPPDDMYWENHRTTPKAFVALDVGRNLWESRFGRTTSFRIPATDTVTADTLARKLLDQLHRDRLTPGFTFLPVRRNAIDASTGATPFDLLFLGFSMFVIASALMLVALLFRLGIEQRAQQIGILLAVGLRRRTTARLFSMEGGIVAVWGGILGVFGGIGYAWLMLVGLKTWWLGAIVTPFVDFHYTYKSLAIGYSAGAITAVATFAWGIANLRRVPLRQLVAGRTWLSPAYVHRRRWLSPALAWVLLVAAMALLAFGTRRGGQAQALAFFGAGATLLAAGLLFVWLWLGMSSPGSGARGFFAFLPLVQLALRSAARNPGRSTLTIGLVAAASFLIVAISAFQLRPSESGTGGFDWLAETDQPIYQDLSSSAGRAELSIVGENEQLLSEPTIVGLRVQSGDDASCLNMFQAKRPRVIGITPALISHFADPSVPRFAFAAPTAGGKGNDENLWDLLQPSFKDHAVPVVLDNNTAMYALHLYGGVGEVFEMTDDVTGRRVQFRVVGLLADSIFQGNLLVSESHFKQLYPDVNGYRMFLIRAGAGRKNNVRRVLEERLDDWGFKADDADEKMRNLQIVQNTYLQTFQVLGALGLLLGTIGLATVQLRSVLERRSELALLRASGFRRGRLAGMVLLENAVLLVGGLLIGVVAALVTVLPHMLIGGAVVPVGTLAGMLGLVLAVGLLSGLAAVRATLRAPLVPALRGD